MIEAWLKLARPFLRQWPLWAVLSSALMLAIAHGFETFALLAPCYLCLKQREVYWTAMAVGAIGVALRYTPWGARTERLVCAVLAVVFLVGLAIAVYHAGVEWAWWPGPTVCASTGSFDGGGIADMLSGEAQPVVSCEKALWVFLGLSMAGWNALISLKLVCLSVAAALGLGVKR
jgi:disulfide bond formation protein DsbB